MKKAKKMELKWLLLVFILIILSSQIYAQQRGNVDQFVNLREQVNDEVLKELKEIYTLDPTTACKLFTDILSKEKDYLNKKCDEVLGKSVENKEPVQYRISSDQLTIEYGQKAIELKIAPIPPPDYTIESDNTELIEVTKNPTYSESISVKAKKNEASTAHFSIAINGKRVSNTVTVNVVKGAEEKAWYNSIRWSFSFPWYVWIILILVLIFRTRRRMQKRKLPVKLSSLKNHEFWLPPLNNQWKANFEELKNQKKTLDNVEKQRKEFEEKITGLKQLSGKTKENWELYWKYVDQITRNHAAKEKFINLLKPEKEKLKKIIFNTLNKLTNTRSNKLQDVVDYLINIYTANSGSAPDLTGSTPARVAMLNNLNNFRTNLVTDYKNKLRIALATPLTKDQEMEINFFLSFYRFSVYALDVNNIAETNFEKVLEGMLIDNAKDKDILEFENENGQKTKYSYKKILENLKKLYEYLDTIIPDLEASLGNIQNEITNLNDQINLMNTDIENRKKVLDDFVEENFDNIGRLGII